MHLQELQGGLGGIELETHVDQHAGVLDKLGLLLRGADGDQDVLRRQLEAGGDHSLQEGLVLILAEASDLTSGLHLHTQPGVRVLQAAEGEDRHLGRDEIHVDGLDHDGALRDAQHDPRRNADEVDVVRLGDEGQGAGCSQVALDDHDLVLLAHELDVEGAGNVQCPADFLADALHAAVRLHEELLCGQEQRRISAVHTCVLHVLCDRIVDNLAIRADGVQLDLLSARDVLRDDDGVITAHNGRVPQESLELLVRVDHTHCRAREHVRGAHQAWEARALGEVEGLLHRGEFGPLRLVDPQGVAQLAEPEAILAHVDGVDVRAQDLNTVFVQAHRQVVRRLPSHGDHDAGRLLQFRNVHDDLMAELLEVEPIGLVEVCRDGLGVAIDDDGLVAQAPQGLDARDRAPIKLHAAADAVAAATEHHDAGLLLSRDEVHIGLDVAVSGQQHVVLDAAVRQVQVVGFGGELGRQGVDLLHKGAEADLLPQAPDVLLLHGSAHVLLLGRGPGGRRLRRDLHGPELLGDLSVCEARALGLAEEYLATGEFREGHGAQGLIHQVDVVQLGQEPTVDGGQLVHILDGHSQPEALGDGPDTRGRRVRQLGLDGLQRVGILVPVQQLVVEALSFEADATLVDHAQGLLDHLLESPADGHDLADALHARADCLVDGRELTEVPARNLGDDVVQRRLEACGRDPGDTVAETHEVAAECELGRDVSQRVTGRLGCQCTASGQTGIHLDDAELLAQRVDGVLDVALADDAQVTNHLESALAKPEVFVVRERLRRGDDNGVAGVGADGVEVLHVADGDAVVVGVPNDLVLQLLPALQALVDDDLRAVDQGLGSQLPQLIIIMGEAAAQAAQCKCGTHKDRVADLLRKPNSILDVGATSALGDLVAAELDSLCEELAIFRRHDCLDGRPHHTHVVLLKDALLVKLDTAHQCRLSTKGAEDAVGPLALDDLCDKLRSHRQKVNAVRVPGRCLHCGDVRVHQNRLDTRLAQRLNGLAAGVVELACLADGQAARAQDQDLALMHRQRIRDGRDARAHGLHDAPNKVVEEEGGIRGATACLWVELHGEPRAGLVDDAFVAAVVGVDHERRPIRKQRG
mmetsp:Transcript_72066/g.203447  ORF Transcript_72066/g.203447 Transcript_72066/m.203447 type:complete len:1095 (-) Transcript_72066:280-3564(-)